MVPQHAPSHARLHPRFPFPRPDPVRIAGISGTLTLNVVALALLLAPLGQPGLLAPADGPVTEVEWVDRRPLPPPTPPPPEQVEVVPPQAVRPAPAQAIPRPEPQAPVVVERGTLPAPDIVEAPAFTGPPVAVEPAAPAGPVSGMRLEYARATPPAYPSAAIRNSLQGTVMLQVLVDVDGRPLEVTIHRSSGHRVLDDAARRHVLRQWSFRPATRDGQPVQAIGLVPIDFNLERH